MADKGILDKLQAQFESSNSVSKVDNGYISIYHNTGGTHVVWGNNDIRLPKYCPEQEAVYYIQGNHNKPLSVIKKELKIHWGTAFKENLHVITLHKDGEYTGNMDYVHHINQNDGDGVYSLKIFVPYFGYIKSASINSEKYDVDYYSELIVELFKKSKTIYFLNLDGKCYKKLKNHYFVHPVYEEEFEQLLKEYGITLPENENWKKERDSYESEIARLNKKCALLESKYLSLEREKNNEITSLKAQHERDIDDLTRDPLNEIVSERWEDPRIGQILFDGHTQSWRRVKRWEFGMPIFHQSSWRFDENQGLEIIFLYKIKGFNPRQIINKIPSLKGLYSSKESTLQAVNNWIKEWHKGNLDHGIQWVQQNFAVEHGTVNLFRLLDDSHVPYRESPDLYSESWV